jgi:hypothetical protein
MNEVRRNNHTVTLLRFLMCSDFSPQCPSHDGNPFVSLYDEVTLSFYLWFGIPFYVSGELEMCIDDRMEMLCERQARRWAAELIRLYTRAPLLRLRGRHCRRYTHVYPRAWPHVRATNIPRTSCYLLVQY